MRNKDKGLPQKLEHIKWQGMALGQLYKEFSTRRLLSIENSATTILRMVSPHVRLYYQLLCVLDITLFVLAHASSLFGSPRWSELKVHSSVHLECAGRTNH